MQIIPLELIQSNRCSVRKNREAYLIERGQTIEPLGLNTKDETLLIVTSAISYLLTFLCIIVHCFSSFVLFIETYRSFFFFLNFYRRL